MEFLSQPTCAKSKLSKVFQKFQTDISEVYDVDNFELESSGSASNVNVEVQKKAVALDMLHAAMKIKLKTVTYPEKIQIVTLAPNSWSRKFCAEYFNVSEYLVRTARELKKEKGILAKPEPKQGKKLSKETVQLIPDFYEDDEYSRQMPGKKDYVSLGRNVHKQKCLVLCNVNELYTAFKQKYPDVTVGFSKFCEL